MNILQFKDDYHTWKTTYLHRVKKNFIGKGGAIGATAFGIGAFMIGSGIGLAIGAVGATASGCYLLWRRLTERKISEKQLYFDMMWTLNHIAFIPTPMLVASAPPIKENVSYPSLFHNYAFNQENKLV